MDKVEDLTPAELIGRILVDVYADAPSGVPRQVLVPKIPDDVEAVTAYLIERRGGPVAIRVPVRGPKRQLQETVTHNADEAFHRHRLQRRPTTTAGPGRSRRCSRAGPARRAAPHRVLRHEPPPGHRLRRFDGRLRGRTARKTEYRHYKVASSPATTTTRPWKRCSPGGSPPCSRRGEADRGKGSRAGGRSRSGRPKPAAGGSPTRPSSCSSTAGRASWAWVSGCSRARG